MADLSTCPPLTRTSVENAHALIKPHIHLTRVITCATLNRIASTPQSSRDASIQPHPPSPHQTANPKINFFFKCENEQRIGAFKARGAFHALEHLISVVGLPTLQTRGVITHSSGNHAQALALAARTFSIPAHIIMPSISTPSKISSTQSLGAHVHFSGSTAPEREALVATIQAQTNAFLIPPYNHPDIILGQGTQALELTSQVGELLTASPTLSISPTKHTLDAVIAPLGGGGMLSGICTALHGTGIRVFGAEPSYQGANDGERGLAQGKRIEHVSSLTIADGARTPVGPIPWSVISDPARCAGVYSASEAEITSALKLALERAKVFIEPTAAVPLAVALFNEEFRGRVEREAGPQGWNVGVFLSGGNTTVEALAGLFGKAEGEGEKAEGKVGVDGERVAQDVAG